MKGMEQFLNDHNFSTNNINYPSRKYQIPTLAKEVRQSIIEYSVRQKPKKLHFVTHSMGGIILRQIQKTNPLPNLGRAIMLGPPNRGSEVVDKLDHLSLFHFLNGPAASQLGTNPESIPNQLGPVTFELGVIAGDRSINPMLSLMIPGKDDGKVSVLNTKIDGMKDFLLINCAHPFLMNNRRARKATLGFLKTGKFPSFE